MPTRRDFLGQSAMAAAAALSAQHASAQAVSAKQVAIKAATKPVIITRGTGDNSVQEAYAMLEQGADTLDAAHHICIGRENDPNDHTVGLGGLPNEEGVVELDSSCMHGPTRLAGSVGGVRNIKNVCLVARKVMENTGHVMLCGEGAERFAVAQGYPRENLLTDDARKIWLLWKEANRVGWWGIGPGNPAWKAPAPGVPHAQSFSHGPLPRIPGPEHAALISQRAQELYARAADLSIAPELRWQAVQHVMFPPTGTIHVSTLNAKGEMSGATTTSGLAWKVPGRLGDSPIIGAGCYTDQDIGSAGATGSGEENIRVAGAHTIVEAMREGMSPQEAGMEALRRIVRNFDNNITRLRYIEMHYYILRRDGAYAGVSLWNVGPNGKPRTFVVHDGTCRVEQMAGLLQGTPLPWPPI